MDNDSDSRVYRPRNTRVLGKGSLVGILALVLTGCRSRLASSRKGQRGLYRKLFPPSMSAWRRCRSATTCARKTSWRSSVTAGSGRAGRLGQLGRARVAAEKLRCGGAAAGGARPRSEERSDLLPAGASRERTRNSAQAIADLRKAVELNPQNLRCRLSAGGRNRAPGATNSDSEFQQADPEDSGGATGQSGGPARAESDCGQARRRRTLKSAVAADQRPLVRSGRRKPSSNLRGCRPPSPAPICAPPPRGPFSAQCVDARSRVSSEPAAFKAPPGDEAQPFTHFLRMESPVFKPAPADMAITFEA